LLTKEFRKFQISKKIINTPENQLPAQIKELETVAHDSKLTPKTRRLS